MELTSVKMTSHVAIHFALPDQVNPHLGTLDLEILEGSVGRVRTEKELFAVVSEAMKFPDYFGNNWDALDECLGDMEWLPSNGYLLILREASKGWAQSAYVLGRFVTCWLEASEYWVKNQTPFHLLFVM